MLLTIYGTPSWANGDQPAAYAPTSATAIAGFATAAARRYPWVEEVGDLERAERDPLAAAGVAERVHDEAAEPGLHGAA